MSEAQTFALTLGLLGVSAVIVAVCFVVEVGVWLYSIRKLSRNESVEFQDQLFTGLLRVRDPLSLGAMGSLLVVIVAFEKRANELFADYLWAGPVAVLLLLGGSLLHTSLKKAAWDLQIQNSRARDQPEEQDGDGPGEGHQKGKPDIGSKED